MEEWICGVCLGTHTAVGVSNEDDEDDVHEEESEEEEDYFVYVPEGLQPQSPQNAPTKEQTKKRKFGTMMMDHMSDFNEMMRA